MDDSSEETKQLPPKMLQTHPAHLVAGQDTKQRYCSSMFAILSERRLRWLGHLRRMDQARIPRALLHEELAERSRIVDVHAYVTKMSAEKTKISGIDVTTWESCADDYLASQLERKYRRQRRREMGAV